MPPSVNRHALTQPQSLVNAHPTEAEGPKFMRLAARGLVSAIGPIQCC